MTNDRLARPGPTWLPVYQRRVWGWWLALVIELAIVALAAWWIV